MSARDELMELAYLSMYPVAADVARIQPLTERAAWEIEMHERAADAILAAGYRKPRTITTAEELEKLPHGSAVQTSDESDTVVLKDGDTDYRNQSGYEVSATDLWRYGMHPLTVLYEGGAA